MTNHPKPTSIPVLPEKTTYKKRYHRDANYVNVANDYSTTRLKQEIRRAKANGCTVIAYDTLKGYF